LIKLGEIPVQQRYLGSSHILHTIHKNNIYKNAGEVIYTENICLSTIFPVPDDLFIACLAFFHF